MEKLANIVTFIDADFDKNRSQKCSLQDTI